MTLPNPIDELIDKLNRWAACSHGRVLAPSDLLETASAALSTLQEQKRKLEEALKPFAEAADDLDYEHRDSGGVWECAAAMSITAGDLRRARALLSGGGE